MNMVSITDAPNIRQGRAIHSSSADSFIVAAREDSLVRRYLPDTIIVTRMRIMSLIRLATESVRDLGW